MWGDVPEEVVEVDLPIGFEYLWAWFLRLNSTRVQGSAIPESEIRAFFLNRQITPEPWEIEALVRLDRTAMHYKDQPEDEG